MVCLTYMVNGFQYDFVHFDLGEPGNISAGGPGRIEPTPRPVATVTLAAAAFPTANPTTNTTGPALFRRPVVHAQDELQLVESILVRIDEVDEHVQGVALVDGVEERHQRGVPAADPVHDLVHAAQARDEAVAGRETARHHSPVLQGLVHVVLRDVHAVEQDLGRHHAAADLARVDRVHVPRLYNVQQSRSSKHDQLLAQLI